MTFEIALTGINAASTELNVISNNIANNATSGFKRSRTEFADIYAQSAFSSSKSTTGKGVRVSTVRQEHTQGDLQFTERNLDLAIEGLGMFQLNDNGSSVFTRSGNFGLDQFGYLVNNQGQRLTGYGVDSKSEILPITTDLQIDFSDLKSQPSARIELTANLDSDDLVPGLDENGVGTVPPFDVNDPDTYNFSTSTLVYDSLGSSEVASLYFRKDTANSWTAYPYVGDMEISQSGTGVELLFNDEGILQSIDGGGLTFESRDFTPAAGGAGQQRLTFDLGSVTQFDKGFGVNQITQDGFAAGRLEDFDVASDGIIFGRFSNGQNKLMGQITLSNFTNEAGLRQIGNTSWVETTESGAPATGIPGSASLGRLESGALEGSNVDITQELVAMIGAQRSFQANAQVISTGDTLTQTVINIRR